MRNTFVIALVICLSVAAASPASAQAPAGEAWKITVVPYLMGAAMNGTTAVKGQEVAVDMSASDIFSNLQFGAMGLVVARKGNWGWVATRFGCRSARTARRRGRWASRAAPT